MLTRTSLLGSLLLGLIVTQFNLVCAQENESESINEYSEQWYKVDALNQGLPDPPDDLNRSTPQACLENFKESCLREDFERAAYSLNLKYIPREKQTARGPELADRLWYVLNQKLWIDFDDLPDRPDGQIDQAGMTPDSLVGKPRRSIRLGIISADGRQLPIRVQRVKPKDKPPVWVLSANTVENIDRLYRAHGPGPVAERMPGWARTRLFWRIPLWQWLALLIAIILGGMVYFVANWIIGRIADRVVGRGDLTRAMQTPIAVLAGLAITAIITWSLSLTGPVAKVLDPVLIILVVAAAAWSALRLMDYLFQSVVVERVEHLDEGQSEREQRLLTRLSIGRRLVMLVIVFAGIGIALVELNLFQTIGVTLLASAGVASVVLGVAAQTVLGNVLAGLQVAITQPVRIGDSVLYEGNWGKVEDIRFTYLAVRTWDMRRVIVPMQYFVSHPFENWTKTEKRLIKPIYMYVDYETDIDAVREEFTRICEGHEKFDGEMEPTLQVTALKEETMELRALCSAKDDSTAWSLHCDLREGLIKFVRDQKQGSELPRRRLEIEGESNGESRPTHGEDSTYR